MREMIFAVICAVAGTCLTCLLGANVFTGPMSVFPLLGQALRSLSLSGGVGNAAAWCIYALLCALPLAGLWPPRRRRSWADALFVLAAAYSLWLWRMLANPTRLIPFYMQEREEVYGMMAGGVLIALLIGGALLRLMEERETGRMVRTAEKTVCAFAMLAGYGAGMNCASALLAAQSAIDRGYAAFLCLCSLAQTGALVRMLGAAADLLFSVQWGWFDEANASLSDVLARRSRMLLIVTVFSALLANAAALLMAFRVSDSNVQLDIPLTELIAAVCCMLLSRFIREGVRIKAENDEFV